jgi:hypothetical protein
MYRPKVEIKGCLTIASGHLGPLIHLDLAQCQRALPRLNHPYVHPFQTFSADELFPGAFANLSCLMDADLILTVVPSLLEIFARFRNFVGHKNIKISQSFAWKMTEIDSKLSIKSG